MEFTLFLRMIFNVSGMFHNDKAADRDAWGRRGSAIARQHNSARCQLEALLSEQKQHAAHPVSKRPIMCAWARGDAGTR